MSEPQPQQPVDQGVSNARGKKAVHWRRDPGILQRLVKVERQHLVGVPNTAIAEALGVDEITIRRDLDRLAELWLERAGDEVDALKARAIAEIEDTRRRALAAAEFDEMAERAVLFGKDADGNALNVDRDEKGSAQFRGQKAQALNVARQASMDKAKILGIILERQEHFGEVLVRRYIGVNVDDV